MGSGYSLFLNTNTNPHNSPLSIFQKNKIKTYDSLIYKSSIRFPVDRAPKSLVHSKNLEKVYVMCLEGMSVIEIDTKTKKRVRTLRFTSSQGMGYNYQKHKWVSSLKEKPVEGILTHNDQYLWISLHNADGVCIWDLNDTSSHLNSPIKAKIIKSDQPDKTLKLPFFDTETTPKFLTNDTANKRIFVSNWHDNSLSIIQYNNNTPHHWKTIKHISTNATPRGIVIDYKYNVLWVGNMGSHNISIYDLNTFQLVKVIQNIKSPRHLVLSNSSVFISQSSAEIISCFDRKNFTKKYELKTLDDPRSIVLSKNGDFLFSTSYADNKLEVFDIRNKKRIYNLTTNGGPVGISILEKDNTLEAWVCNYKFSTIKVFTFKYK